MKKIGIITFHMAHNYGSMLQAWALQHSLEQSGYDAEIINYQNQAVIDQYRIFPRIKKIKNIFRNLIFVIFYFSLRRKHRRFESFQIQYLKLGRKYSSLTQLMQEPPEYDNFITGSDQVWNFSSGHTDDAYFLSFVREGKKISYAASFGPLSIAEQDRDFYQKKIKTLLADFHAISVREEHSAEIIEKGLGTAPVITLDPTLLVDSKVYLELIRHIPVRKNKYIFFYTLGPTPEMIQIAKQISSTLGYQVIISKFNNEIDLFTPFKKDFTTGPLEFIAYIRDASLVITSSYHATVFSIRFEKPFFAINGMTDHRISTLLKKCSLEDRSIGINQIEERMSHVWDIDFGKSREQLPKMVATSMKFLSDALES